MCLFIVCYDSHSFERVHKESNVWWAWLRCGLIEEFYGRPALPPPFTLLYRAFRILRLLTRRVWSACCTLVACLTCFRRRRGSSKCCIIIACAVHHSTRADVRRACQPPDSSRAGYVVVSFSSPSCHAQTRHRYLSGLTLWRNRLRET